MISAPASIRSNCSFLSPLRLCLLLPPPPNIQMVRSRTCTIIRIGFVWPPSPHCFSSVPFLPPIMLFFSFFFNDPASLLIMQPLAIQLCSPNFTSSLICKSLSFWLQTLLITPVPSSRKGRKKEKDYVSFILSRFPMDQRR